MKIVFVFASLLGGALFAWLSVIGGVWYVAPVVLGGVIVMCFALDRASRWRLAAFSLGMIAVYALEAQGFAQDISAKQARALERIRTEPAPKLPPKRGGLLG